MYTCANLQRTNLFLYFWWSDNFFFPGTGEPEEAGGDNPSAHGRVWKHHHQTTGMFKAPRKSHKPLFLSGTAV